jgi:hypothetical protein
MSGVDDDELPGLAEDVVYELAMLNYAATELRVAPPPTPNLTTTASFTIDTYSTSGPDDVEVDPQQRWAMVEVLLLHARILRDFFAGHPTSDDDLVAEHYDPDWHQRCAEDPDADAALTWLTSSTFRTRLNKRLAHLTASRRRWPTEDGAPLATEVQDKVLTLARFFLAGLSEERRAWFIVEESANTRGHRRDATPWTRTGVANRPEASAPRRERVSSGRCEPSGFDGHHRLRH